MKRAISLPSSLIFFGFLSLSVLACAKSPEEEPLPVHPFPRWVEELESGRTRAEDIRMRFGEPTKIEQDPRGEKTWRYVFHEIAWPAKDPMRPVVAADGTIQERERSAFGRFVDWLGGVTYWVDRAMYFPPLQDRAARTRRLPATVHQLEVVFDPDGTLRRYRYRSQSGYANVALIH